MNARLSIITTLYDCEEYIEESLYSIANQTYKDFEWIILDDGSTDSTPTLVKNFIKNNPDIDIIYKQSSENIKIPRRRNEAIETANGKYVAIHDGDDISLSDRLASQMKIINRDDDIFCIGGHAIRIDSKGEESGIMNYPPLSNRDIFLTLLNDRKNPMIDPTTIFNRLDFLRLGKYTLDKSIYTVPDMDLWCRALLDGLKFRNINKPVIKYRVNPEGMTRIHNSEMIKAHVKVWSNFYRTYFSKKEQNKNVQAK